MTLKDRWRKVQLHTDIPAEDQDGIPGPQTLGAIERALGIGPLAATPPSTGGITFDARTEENLATLHTNVQPVFREFIRLTKQAAKIEGVSVKVICGSRSWAEQDELYAQGRTKPGARVTKARGGDSWHNYQLAIDLGVFSADGKRYLDGSDPARASKFYREFAMPIARSLGLECGGDWTSIVDEPHYQFATGLTIAQARARVKAGKPIV